MRGPLNARPLASNPPTRRYQSEERRCRSVLRMWRRARFRSRNRNAALATGLLGSAVHQVKRPRCAPRHQDSRPSWDPPVDHWSVAGIQDLSRPASLTALSLERRSRHAWVRCASFPKRELAAAIIRATGRPRSITTAAPPFLASRTHSPPWPSLHVLGRGPRQSRTRPPVQP